jgi:hypothetical protein
MLSHFNPTDPKFKQYKLGASTEISLFLFPKIDHRIKASETQAFLSVINHNRAENNVKISAKEGSFCRITVVQTGVSRNLFRDTGSAIIKLIRLHKTALSTVEVVLRRTVCEDGFGTPGGEGEEGMLSCSSPPPHRKANFKKQQIL